MAQAAFTRLLHIAFFVNLLFSLSVFSEIDASFLLNNQEESGSIAASEGQATDFQSTAHALMTLHQLDSTDVLFKQKAQNFLSASMVDSTENLSLRVLSAHSITLPEVAADLSTVLLRQNTDGGLGFLTGFDSDVLSTAFALNVLAVSNIVNNASARMVGFLIDRQQPNGSWEINANKNSVEVTAVVLNAVWHYREHYQLTKALTKGADFLKSQREANGLWTSLESSAYALIALLNTDNDRQPIQASLESFATLQDVDGSFGSDTYLTALGLRVLDAMGKPAPDEIILEGRVVDGDSNLPISNAIVSLSGAYAEELQTDDQGLFSIGQLPPGFYNLSVEKSGFSPFTISTLLSLGDQSSMGDLQLTKLQTDPDTGEIITTGTIRGTVTNKRTGESVQSANVSIEGTDLLAVTNADGFYQIDLVPAGDIQISAIAAGYAKSLGNASIESGQTLIFSPSLVESVEEKVSVAGVIVEKDSLEPLSNVLVIVTDEAGVSIEGTTDNTGSYLIENVTAGELSILSKLSGYFDIAANADVAPGTQINFSPVLMPEGGSQEINTTGGIRLAVVDEATRKGIPGVNIHLQPLLGDAITLLTDSDGGVTKTDIPEGKATLLFEHVDYSPLSLDIEVQS
ncbi:MAG: carboxypeptidase regulatory-like domain-containing protein, partial [Cellvibrionales bacterium]|nr:carboxypeptidase regulatory-like domain-containing protein [Cellvibrionales bacterium]